MKIIRKRIQSLNKHLIGLNNNDNFYVALTNLSNSNRIKRAGFSNQLNIGEQVLPTVIGRTTNFNANGGYVAHRHMPLEDVYKQVDIKDWRGNYHTVDIPYKRYPRTYIKAPLIEITIVSGANNQNIIRSPKLIKGVSPEIHIKHIINLFLELFGECDIIQENLLPVFNVPITRLNWNLLPQGNYPWAVLKNNIQKVIGNVGVNKRHLIESRLELISNHNPNFVAVGNAGFKGYIVFGFPNKQFFILESIHSGNATYVFGQNWQQLSQLTKEQILNKNLQQNRFVHSVSWSTQINDLF